MLHTPLVVLLQPLPPIIVAKTTTTVIALLDGIPTQARIHIQKCFSNAVTLQVEGGYRGGAKLLELLESLKFSPVQAPFHSLHVTKIPVIELRLLLTIPNLNFH